MSEDKISVLKLNLNKAYDAGIDLLGKINKANVSLHCCKSLTATKGHYRQFREELTLN